MKDLKISNKLLSWVLGCECEFVKYDNQLGLIINPKTHNAHFTIMETVGVFFSLGLHYINLHSLLHLAKIKAFECGYDCTPRWDANTPFDSYKDFLFYANATHPTSCKDCDNYDSIYGKELHEAELEALEWVAEKLEKK